MNIMKRMKAIKGLMTAAVIAGSPMVMQGQTPAFVGVRLSWDITHASGNAQGYENGSGFTISGVYNVPLSRNVYLESGAGVFYNTIGIKPFEAGNALWEGSVRNSGIRIPLNLGYRVGLFEGFEMSAFTGPWLNINLTARGHLDPNFIGEPPSAWPRVSTDGWHRLDMQWGFGITATYADRYYLSVSGGIGATRMATFDHDDGKTYLRRNTFNLTVGYNF